MMYNSRAAAGNALLRTRITRDPNSNPVYKRVAQKPFTATLQRVFDPEPIVVTINLSYFQQATLSSLARIAHLPAAKHLCVRHLLDVQWQYGHGDWDIGSNCSTQLNIEVSGLCTVLADHWQSLS